MWIQPSVFSVPMAMKRHGVRQGSVDSRIHRAVSDALERIRKADGVLGTEPGGAQMRAAIVARERSLADEHPRVARPEQRRIYPARAGRRGRADRNVLLVHLFVGGVHAFVAGLRDRHRLQPGLCAREKPER